MKPSYLLLLLVLFFFSCDRQEKELIIQGSISHEKSFENELVYLYPMFGDSLAMLDSAVIKDSRFMFTIPAGNPTIRVIRTKNPVLQYYLQPLLVVIEPGRLDVEISNKSSGSGTPLNNLLQEWKENKIRTDSIFFDLQEKYRNADESKKKQIESEKELLIRENKEYNDEIITENKDNVLGQFLRQLVG